MVIGISMNIGLDASTTTVGWSFYDGKLITDAGFFDISKIDTNKNKALKVATELEKNSHFKESSFVNLESPLLGFTAGRTSQQTIVMLIRWNAILEYILSERWNIPVNLVSVTTARKKAFGKCRVKGMSGKEYVKMMLPKIHPEISTFEKMNSKNNWDVKNLDMYDAVVMSIV